MARDAQPGKIAALAVDSAQIAAGAIDPGHLAAQCVETVALDDVMLDAEATLPEDVTHRAGLIALVLTRWGYDPATVTRAYVRALDRTEAAGWPLVEGAADEEDAALALASWMTELHLDHFDLERWELVSGLLTAARASSWTRLSPTLALTFPPTRG